LLAEPWSKDVEDQTDALVCSLIAWWHHQYEGLRTQQLGDPTTGLMLVPLLSKEHATQESRA
jgi:predicted RNase H-like nuclease